MIFLAVLLIWTAYKRLHVFEFWEFFNQLKKLRCFWVIEGKQELGRDSGHFMSFLKLS